MQIQFNFIANVGKSIHVTNVTVQDKVVLDTAYLAASQVNILKSKENLYTADVPAWLIMNKIQESKDQYTEAQILAAASV